jgi:hypothetical protein
VKIPPGGSPRPFANHAASVRHDQKLRHAGSRALEPPDLFALLRRPSGFISRGKGGIMCSMPKKPPPTVIPTKKPLPLVKPIPPVPLAVIPPLKPGVVAKNATGKISRPNPVVRRGKR